MTVTTGTTVTLSGAGVYIFRPGGALDSAASSNVVATGGACANEVFWAPVGGTTIGANSNFVGNIFRGTAAGLSITLGNSANLTGRALAFGSTVTTDTNTITVPSACVVPPARLALAKTVVNTGGGTALASAFTLTATGPTVISGPGPLVAATNAPVGVYTLSETGLTSYTAGLFSCIGGGTLAGNQLTILAADAGNTIACTITNTFNGVPPARLALAKTVVGGTALASAFKLTATGPTVVSGTAPVAATNAPVGDYTLTEIGPTGYTAGSFICSGGGNLAGNLLTISSADTDHTITCTITNTFASVTLPTMRVTKVSNGGVGLFNFTGSNGFASQNITTATSGAGVAGATQTLTAAGVPTTITEAAPPTGFTLASISCTGLGESGTATPDLGTRTVELNGTATAAGAAIACTFTNTFNVPVAATSIPTLSEWAMIVLAALMAITGFVAMRRKEM